MRPSSRKTLIKAERTAIPGSGNEEKHTQWVVSVVGPLSSLFSFTKNILGCSLMHGGGLVAHLRPTLATPWTVARQAPLSMEFSRKEYWSGLLFPKHIQTLMHTLI